MDLHEATRAILSSPFRRDRERLVRLLEPSIRLIPQPVEAPAVGASRLGGLPDLPPGTEWPRWHVPRYQAWNIKTAQQFWVGGNDADLSLVAQLRLADLPPLARDSGLPPRGTLLFFWDVWNRPYWGKFEDGGGWRVIYTEMQDDDLHRATPPATLPADQVLQPFALRFEVDVTMPGWAVWALPDWKRVKDDDRARGRLCKRIAKLEDRITGKYSGHLIHRMLGHEQYLQNQIRVCVMPGIDSDEDPTLQAILRGERQCDWQLLLQLEGDPDGTGPRGWWTWGCRLFFFIHRDDLAARRFERTRAAFECS